MRWMSCDQCYFLVMMLETLKDYLSVRRFHGRQLISECCKVKRPQPKKPASLRQAAAVMKNICLTAGRDLSEAERLWEEFSEEQPEVIQMARDWIGWAGSAAARNEYYFQMQEGLIAFFHPREVQAAKDRLQSPPAAKMIDGVIRLNTNTALGFIQRTHEASVKDFPHLAPPVSQA